MNTDAKKTVSQNFFEHQRTAAELAGAEQSVAKAAESVAHALQKNGTVWLCGNGGSAADCEHIAAEFVNRYKKERKPLPAVSLVSNISSLTAIANDYSFDLVFSKPILALAKKEDIVWAISTSGKSRNIIEALKAARQKKAFSILFTGNTQNPAAELADLVVAAPSSDTPRIQEMHLLFYHSICEIVESELSEK